MVDAIIVSDFHLGSDICQAKKLCTFLERIHDGELHTRRLILNGDLFNSIDFRRLKKHHWNVLSLIRKLSDTIDVIWICGNHDGPADSVSHLLGTTVVDEFLLESGRERILILHGHQFDAFIDKHPWITLLGDLAYWFLQSIDPSHRVARFAKHSSKTFLRCAQKIEEGSREHARRKHCTAVCCGHTHHAKVSREQSPSYFNSGCWTENPCTYLTVRDGDIQLHNFEKSLAPPRNGYLEEILAS